jgi:hypothetical protein
MPAIGAAREGRIVTRGIAWARRCLRRLAAFRRVFSTHRAPARIARLGRGAAVLHCRIRRLRRRAQERHNR